MTSQELAESWKDAIDKAVTGSTQQKAELKAAAPEEPDDDDEAGGFGGGDEDEDEDEESDYGEEDDAAADEIVDDKKPAKAKDSSKKEVIATSNISERQKEADKQLGERYPKFAEAVKVLETLREKYPQFGLDGERNIWICKPAGSSRGRGICLKKDLCEILDMIKFKDSSQAISNQKNGQLYICQKYIENTLIMKCRKFDIR